MWLYTSRRKRVQERERIYLQLGGAGLGGAE